MNWQKFIIDGLLAVASVVAINHPVGLVVVGMAQKIVKTKRESISNESYKQVMIEMAKSKGNDITQKKVAKALKTLGLDDEPTL